MLRTIASRTEMRSDELNVESANPSVYNNRWRARHALILSADQRERDFRLAIKPKGIMATKKAKAAKAAQEKKSAEFAYDFLSKESEALLVDFIGRKCAEVEGSEVEKAAKLLTIKEAFLKAEPIQRAKALAQLLKEFPDEAMSGQRFTAYGIEVDIQQVPTYEYEPDNKLQKLQDSVRYWKAQLEKADGKLKAYQNFLVKADKAVLKHMSLRLRIHRK